MGHKIVYNDRYGGFDLSEMAISRYAELVGKRAVIESRSPLTGEPSSVCLIPQNSDFLSVDEAQKIRLNVFEIPRHDVNLVRVVEELGREASGMFSSLSVKEIKGDTYRIREYDGAEQIIEPEDEKYIVIGK